VEYIDRLVEMELKFKRLEVKLTAQGAKIKEQDAVIQKMQSKIDELLTRSTSLPQLKGVQPSSAIKHGDVASSVTNREHRRAILNSLIHETRQQEAAFSTSRQLSGGSLSNDMCSGTENNITTFLVEGICSCRDDVVLGDNRSLSSMADKIEDYAVRLDDIELAQAMVNVTVKVRTSFAANSETQSSVDIAFFLPKYMYWTQQSELFPEAMVQGEIFNYSIELMEKPTKLKFIAVTNHGWNFDSLEVLIADEPSVFVVCNGDNFWVDLNRDDDSLVQQFDIVGQSCS
jgi:hypothetical protein